MHDRSNGVVRKSKSESFMTPRKSLDHKAQANKLPKQPEIEDYDDLPESVVEKLRDRFGKLRENAKPVSVVSW